MDRRDAQSILLQCLRPAGAAVFAVLLCLQTSRAQDTQYWNIQYGTRSTLLGGAVIGSVADLSATYYNPGALGLSRTSGLILSTGVYEGNSLALEGEGIEKRKVSSFAFNVAPSLVAGRVPADSGAADRLAYSIITRQRADITLLWRFVGESQSIPGVWEPGSVSQNAELTQSLVETWAGITWSRPVSEVVGVGVTSYFAFRSQDKGSTVSLNSLADSAGVAGFTYGISHDYYNVRVLWKAGLAVDLAPLSFGVTLTTPSVNLFGSGTAFVSTQANGVDLDGDSVPDPAFVADYQEELSSTYRSSWAAGIGASYQLDEFRFDVSAEWYAAVARFNILEPSSFTGQSTGAQYQNTLAADLDPVLNVGAGVQYDAGEFTSWYASVTTDNSGAKTGSGSNFAISTLDFINATGGGIFSIGRSKITLGLGYASGSKEISLGGNPIFRAVTAGRYAAVQDLTLTSSRMRLIFAFSYGI